MTDRRYVECDKCKKEISENDHYCLSTNVKIQKDYRALLITTFHVCRECAEKLPFNLSETKLTDYKDNVYNLLNDLLIEMGVQFEE